MEEKAADAAASGPVTYAIVPSDDNIIGFTGFKVTGKKQGGWGEFDGTVVVTDGNIETAQINLTFPMASLFTTAPLLTETLMEEAWFNVAQFPDAKFVSTGVTKGDDGYVVKGNLTIRGVEKRSPSRRKSPSTATP
jgi:polyisoprenoid-binding protein YceI